jgi:hypothetical protein
LGSKLVPNPTSLNDCIAQEVMLELGPDLRRCGYCGCCGLGSKVGEFELTRKQSLRRQLGEPCIGLGIHGASLSVIEAAVCL